MNIEYKPNFSVASSTSSCSANKPCFLKFKPNATNQENRNNQTYIKIKEETWKRKSETKGEAREADWDLYNFHDSGTGKSWLIGTDVYTGSSIDYANAYRDGIKKCPLVLEIPGTLTDSNGLTLPVKIIGRGAFIACGCHKDCLANGRRGV